METKELTLGQLAHCQAACQVIGTALMALMGMAPTKRERRFFDGLVAHIVETNSEAIATLEALLLANNGELSKRLNVGFTVSI